MSWGELFIAFGLLAVFVLVMLGGITWLLGPGTEPGCPKWQSWTVITLLPLWFVFWPLLLAKLIVDGVIMCSPNC